MLKRGEETRVTDPNTGGQKGVKPERFSLLPFDALDEIVRSYDYGAKKYSPHNWRRGYAWSLSFDALMRHLTAWWEGENIDPESGHSHLAHAGWHVLALLWFQLNAKGTDDRLATQPTEVAGGSEIFVPGSLRNQDGLGRIRNMEGKLLSPEEMEQRAADKRYASFMDSYDPATRTWILSREGYQK